MKIPAIRWLAAVVAATVLAAGGYRLGEARSTAGVPRDGSVEVGFLRDMLVHHEQAVVLAMIVHSRATRVRVRELADDIATGQQREVGLMTGWLQQWGLPASTTTPPMTWMGHAVPPPAPGPPDGAQNPGDPDESDPPMPGMATRREVARLAVTRGPAADLLFCRLMVPHHQGALHMIDEVLRRGHRPEVLTLARQMRTDQSRELVLLNDLVAQLSGTAGRR